MNFNHWSRTEAWVIAHGTPVHCVLSQCICAVWGRRDKFLSLTRPFFKCKDCANWPQQRPFSLLSLFTLKNATLRHCFIFFFFQASIMPLKGGMRSNTSASRRSVQNHLFVNNEENISLYHHTYVSALCSEGKQLINPVLCLYFFTKSPFSSSIRWVCHWLLSAALWNSRPGGCHKFTISCMSLNVICVHTCWGNVLFQILIYMITWTLQLIDKKRLNSEPWRALKYYSKNSESSRQLPLKARNALAARVCCQTLLCQLSLRLPSLTSCH